MKNLLLLLVAALVGCASVPEDNAPKSKPVKDTAQSTSPQKTYTLQEIGITMEVPAGAEYVNWSRERFLVMAHPLTTTPGAAGNYAIMVEGGRIPQQMVSKTLVGNNESKEMQLWLNRFHTKSAANSEGGISYVRKDIMAANGDVICIKATIRPSPRHSQDVKFAKRLIDSVKLLEGAGA